MMATPSPQAAELRRLNSERAQQQLDVSRVDAEDQEVMQRNTALNKQQNALQAEVRRRLGVRGGKVEGGGRESTCHGHSTMVTGTHAAVYLG